MRDAYNDQKEVNVRLNVQKVKEQDPLDESHRVLQAMKYRVSTREDFCLLRLFVLKMTNKANYIVHYWRCGAEKDVRVLKLFILKEETEQEGDVIKNNRR